MSTDMKCAVIYCRVSSTKQTKVGDGLASQKTRCMEYANARGYKVLETFSDDASGSLINRPAMKAMLAFLRKNRNAGLVVLIDDISRLARGVKAHIELRAAISVAGGTLESPSVEFGDDADSELQEYILATVAQHQRRKNAEQTRNRMRARLLNGYWPFACPVGYRYQRVSGRGNMLVRDEPLASIVQEALEGYASGRFQLQAEVGRFLESFPEFLRVSKGQVRPQKVIDILTRPVYAGYVASENWDVSLRKGQHEALISYEMHLKIQERLKGNARAPYRKDLSADFPLRGAVVCGDCGTLLTACWSKGRTDYHPYYLCRNRGCDSYGKSIRRNVIEEDFERLLHTMQPSATLFKAAKAMFKDIWDHRLAMGAERVKELKTELGKVNQQVEQFLDRIADATVPSVITAYETRIKALEDRKIVLAEKIATTGRPVRSFDETVRTAIEFLASPCLLWTSDRIEDKRTVLKLAFADRLAYTKKQGFRTPAFSLPFKALGHFAGQDFEMARPAGIEPAALGFGGQYSIH